ncbi:MAG: hypothetical protein GY723_14305 [bacterium]|nr:hypothetical protein [bacterium]
MEFPAGIDVAVDPSGAMIFMRPESHDGISRNGDADSDDFVAYLHRGRDAMDVLLPTAESTSLAATEVSLATDTAAVAVSEGDQGETILNADGDTDDSVLHVCDTSVAPLTCESSGFAVTGATQAIAPDSSHPRAWAVAFLVPESGQGASSLNPDADTDDNVLFLATKDSPPQVVNTGYAAEDFVVGEGFVAFRVPEAGQGGGSLNADGDTSDLVLHVLDLTKDPDSDPTAIQSSGSSAVLCEMDICDPTVPYRVDGRTVRFLTREPDEQRDLNDDLDQLDLVVQLLNLDAQIGEQVQVVSVVEELSPDAENLGLGLDPLATPPFDDGNSSQVLLARGVCLADSGLSCTAASQCAIGEVCSASTCQRRGATCAGDDDCLGGSGEVCAPDVAAIGATNSDSDKIPDALDNCPVDFNPDQVDQDGDGVGDECDVETCGNGGIPEGSEECDDGNTDNGDGCSQFCRVAGCQGDVNLDGRIDQTDMDQFDDTEGCFACAGPGCNDLCDLNGDGNVNNADVFELRSELGFFCSGVPLSSGGGPTPICGVGAELVLLVPLLALWRRRKLGGRFLG